MFYQNGQVFYKYESDVSDFLWKLLRLNSTGVTSFCMQQVKVGQWLLLEACLGGVKSRERKGRESVQENDGEH